MRKKIGEERRKWRWIIGRWRKWYPRGSISG